MKVFARFLLVVGVGRAKRTSVAAHKLCLKCIIEEGGRLWCENQLAKCFFGRRKCFYRHHSARKNWISKQSNFHQSFLWRDEKFRTAPNKSSKMFSNRMIVFGYCTQNRKRNLILNQLPDGFELSHGKVWSPLRCWPPVSIRLGEHFSASKTEISLWHSNVGADDCHQWSLFAITCLVVTRSFRGW